MYAYKSSNINKYWNNKLATLVDDRNVDSIVNTYVDKLKIDINLDEPSDCALNCPRLNGHYDKISNVAHKIAFAMYPLNKEEEFIRAKKQVYVKYTRLLSSLSKKFKDKLEEEDRILKEKKQIPHYVRQNFCTMKNKPISKAITEPTAMSVDVAPLEELEPFLKFMKENKEVKDEFQQFTRGTMFKDGRLDMCKQVVGSQYIGKLMDSIKDNEYITHFLLGNNITNLEGAKSISNFITDAHKSKIETWYLAGNDISSEGICLIAKSLETDTDCQDLWLKRNPLKSEGINYLADMLKKNNTINTMDLDNTCMLDVTYFFNSLKDNPSLRTLYLGSNGITNIDQICYYFDYLVDNNQKGLVNLCLSLNRIGNEGAVKLGKSLEKYHHMERLYLGSNRIENEGCESLLKNLVTHPNLILLDIGYYKSTYDMNELPNNINNIDLICDFIENNKTVKVLSIMNNHFTTDDLTKFAKAFESNKTILFVNYAQYGVDVTQETHRSLLNTMTRNIKTNLGLEYQDFISNHLRQLKHTNKINHIDSIYRNKM